MDESAYDIGVCLDMLQACGSLPNLDGYRQYKMTDCLPKQKGIPDCIRDPCIEAPGPRRHYAEIVTKPSDASRFLPHTSRYIHAVIICPQHKIIRQNHPPAHHSDRSAPPLPPEAPLRCHRPHLLHPLQKGIGGRNLRMPVAHPHHAGLHPH